MRLLATAADRVLRSVGRLLGFTLLWAALPVVALSATRPVVVGPARALPPQGLYESCSPAGATTCLDRLTTMASGGFTLVVNYDQLYGTTSDQLAYAERARRLGLQIIWNLSDRAFWNGTDLTQHFSAFAQSCHARNNDAVLACYVNLVKALPATWGYYIGDEVPVHDEPGVEALADRIARLDPAHPRLIVAVGEPILQHQERRLEPFERDASVLGADFYPVSTGDPISDVGAVASNVQAIDDRSGRASTMVLQAFDWGEYPNQTWVCSPFPQCAHFPTEADMRRMRDDALARARPRVLLWYSFFDIFRSDAPERHWTDLIRAAGTH